MPLQITNSFLISFCIYSVLTKLKILFIIKHNLRILYIWPKPCEALANFWLSKFNMFYTNQKRISCGIFLNHKKLILKMIVEKVMTSKSINDIIVSKGHNLLLYDCVYFLKRNSGKISKRHLTINIGSVQ